MAVTPHCNFDLPDPSRNIADEFPVIGRNFEKADTALAETAESLKGKAAKKHSHAMQDITGLQDALNSKAPKGEKLKFTALAGVDGFDMAKLGYVAVKTDPGIAFRSPQAALGDHQHRIDDIKGLSEQLDYIKNEADRRNKDNDWSGNNVFWKGVSFNKSLEVRDASAPQLPWVRIALARHDQDGGGIILSPQSAPDNCRVEIAYFRGGGFRIYTPGGGNILTLDKEGYLTVQGAGVRWGKGVNGKPALLAPNGDICGDVWVGLFGRPNPNDPADAWGAWRVKAYIDDAQQRAIDWAYANCVAEMKTSGYWEYGYMAIGGRQNFGARVITSARTGSDFDGIGTRDLLYRVGNSWRQPWIG